MKIVLTGTSGFLGARVAARLARAHEIYCISRSAHDALPPEAVCIHGDLTGQLEARRLPARIDAIVHLAQSELYRSFPEGAEAVFAVNVGAVAALLDYARRAGASRFILASTGSVYEPYRVPLAEDAPVAPTGFYPATKLSAESLVRSYGGLLRASSLRLFCVYGPGQANRLIPLLIERIRAGRPVRLDGPGDGLTLTPSFVDDVSAVFEAALHGGWDGVLNVAAPQPVSIRELALLIGGRVGREPVFERNEAAPAARIVPDLRRLAERYDLRNFRSCEAGLAETIRR